MNIKLNEKGIAITETLVAILILALFVGVLATTVTAASKSLESSAVVSKKNEKCWDAYYTLEPQTQDQDAVTIKITRTDQYTNDTIKISGVLNAKKYSVEGDSYEVYDFSAAP